jgi:excisionase family DNA binding protein
MTVPDAAKWLGISKRAAYRAVEDGTLPVIRIGSQRLLVPRPQLETLLAGRSSSARTPKEQV